MTAPTYRTNRQWRPLLTLAELGPEAVAAHDYLDPEASAFEYHGEVYPLADFMAPTSPDMFTGAPFPVHGYAGDSYFSGLLVQVSRDGERVRVARYLA